ELRGEDTLDLANILEFACCANDRVDIKCGLCELLKFWDRMIIDVQEVEFEKRLLIHLVWCVQVSEELIDLAIGQDGYPGIRDMEVAEQLTGVIDIERFADFLAFDEYLDFAVFQ